MNNFAPGNELSWTPAGLVLAAWLPLAVIVFWIAGRRKGLYVVYLTGLLFLPHVMLPTPFLPLEKFTSVSLGALLAVLVHAPRRLASFRPRWVDAPMLLWCLVPAASCFSNDLAPYDAAVASSKAIAIWGIPWLLGRVYVTDLRAARDFARATVVAGLIYMPLCLLEIRLSPILHLTIYQTAQHEDFFQAIRDGGYRPLVFLQHGLAVGAFMGSAALLAVWLWRTRSVRRVFSLPVGLWACALLATLVLIKSTGATVLTFIGLGALFVTRWGRTYLLIYCLALLPPAYVAMRIVGGWTGEDAVAYAKEAFGPQRAQSLEFRMTHENAYIEHDLAKPLLGYGPGSTFIVNPGTELKDVLVVDSLWIITYSITGAVGLVAFLLLFIPPVVLLLRRVPPRYWAHPHFAAVSGFIMVVLLHALDDLSNAMINPVFIVAMGGLAALSRKPSRKQLRAQAEGLARLQARALASLQARAARQLVVAQSASRPRRLLPPRQIADVTYAGQAGSDEVPGVWDDVRA